MAGQLEGKVAVITGGASGIGRACAERFAAEGADVVVSDINPTRGAETVAAVRALGRRATYVNADTSREADTEALAEAALREFGRLDVCVAAAGVSNAEYVSGAPVTVEMGQRLDQGYIVNQPVEHWEKVLAVNLTGVMLTDRAVARRMIAAGNGGSIINIASIMAKVAMAGASNYCVSKTGVWMLTKVLALELAPHRVRVNAIGPGFIETPMTAAIRSDETFNRMILSQTPMGRFGQPAEIASTALFLASDESSFYTGQLLHPDGGYFTG